MCGLLGFVGDGLATEADRVAVAQALADLHHRGPDETRVELLGYDAVLGFKRLSIIDIATSSQPLGYADGRYTIAFNGEIYNYVELRDQLAAEHGARFATTGDTEVIVAGYHAWGREVVSRLRGMFSFLIWDSEQRIAFGARDRFGIKPLYYLQTARGLFVASEKKALLRFAPSATRGAAGIDLAGVSNYLTMQYVPEPGSLHRGIARLGAGEYFTHVPGGPIQIGRYSRLDFRPTPPDDPDRLYDQIRETLRESVRVHMRSDVPVGAFLSSGIDSAAIVALASQFNPQLPTFTAALEVPGYSELKAAARTARALGVTNESVVVTPQMMMDGLPKIIWHLDDPIADPSLVPLYYVARRASEQVTVALSGEGADELFGGYTIYREPAAVRPVRQLPATLQHGLRAIGRTIPQGVKGHSYLERATTPIERRYFGNARIFTERQKSMLMRDYPDHVRYHHVTAPLYAECAHLGDVERMQYIDLNTWLTGDILVKADRMSMANALEVRVPYLDPEVFAVAAGIPTGLKLPFGTSLTKMALRLALRHVVPDDVVNRPKLGFPTPIRVWLRGEMYAWTADILGTSGARQILDLDYVLGLLRDHRAGKADHSRAIWTVLAFCVWYGIFIDGTIVPGDRSVGLRQPPGDQPAGGCARGRPGEPETLPVGRS
ncbi:MAG: asparagine synthase (glutamine-hydrolyzing) [Dactylosporangium sp.]|nr:asparagine synthase (glutamine-hydrolyzing) [Dactylosporangium sp.]NNJ61482.1 asparagine synthase (glutamine-hydrolyzing) [Dactylosporangium sp.]